MVPGSLQRSCLASAAALVSVCAQAQEAGRQWQAVPVEGGLDALARAADLEPGLPAWRVLYEACRRRHGLWGEDAGGAAPSDELAGAAGEGAVPLPLGPAFWRGQLRNGARLSDGQIALAILGDRRAALFYRGVAGLDEATLEALAGDGDTLRRIQRRSSAVLAAFGSRFAVRGGVVAVPGGPEAEAIWQAVVGESPRAPGRFLQKLLEKDAGRLAFVYDSVARLDPSRQRLALGLPAPAGAEPAAPLRALVAAFRGEASWWRPGGRAFARPDADAARLLREIGVGDDGVVAPPASRAFWAAALEEKRAAADEIRAAPRVDVAWLAARVASGDADRRRLRLEQVSFAQRVFGAEADAAPLEAAEAVSGLVDARALVLSLERMGSRDPAFFAAVVRGARASLVRLSPKDRSLAHAGLQGALGVVARARFNGAIDVQTAERLTRSLVEAPLAASVPWDRGLGGWVERTLVAELAALVGGGGDADQIVLRAMAGAAAARSPGPVFDWEGLWYRAQPERAELRRLEGVRRRQGSRRLAEALRGCRDPKPDGPPCAHAVGGALTSLVYAAHLGAPDGPALRGEDPARRHVFDPDPWALPVERAGPGIPWHVQGSLLGLETALARLTLRPLDAEALPDRAPVIDAAQRRGLALGPALANGSELEDPDGDGLAKAVAAGRQRVLALRASVADLESVERDAGLDPWRARALEWLLVHEPGALESFFSLGELAYVGQPSGGRWDGWGAPDPTVAGLKLRLRPPRPLDDSSGRRPERALGEGFVDLGVRVAVHLAERGLPASLAPWMIAALLPNLFVEARPVAPDDRLALDAWVREQPADRFDDAVASLVGQGPLVAARASERAN